MVENTWSKHKCSECGGDDGALRRFGESNVYFHDSPLMCVAHLNRVTQAQAEEIERLRDLEEAVIWIAQMKGIIKLQEDVCVSVPGTLSFPDVTGCERYDWTSSERKEAPKLIISGYAHIREYPCGEHKLELPEEKEWARKWNERRYRR